MRPDFVSAAIDEKEVVTLAVDFSRSLEEEETILTKNIVCYDEEGEDITGEVLRDSSLFENIVTFMISPVEQRNIYIEILARSSSGNEIMAVVLQPVVQKTFRTSS